jgi:hypothetical protein
MGDGRRDEAPGAGAADDGAPTGIRRDEWRLTLQPLSARWLFSADEADELSRPGGPLALAAVGAMLVQGATNRSADAEDHAAFKEALRNVEALVADARGRYPRRPPGA